MHYNVPHSCPDGEAIWNSAALLREDQSLRGCPSMARQLSARPCPRKLRGTKEEMCNSATQSGLMFNLCNGSLSLFSNSNPCGPHERDPEPNREDFLSAALPFFRTSDLFHTMRYPPTLSAFDRLKKSRIISRIRCL